MTGFDSKRRMAADKLQEPWNEDEWRRNNWRCGHGWLRGEQCEICNASQPAQEPVEHLWLCLGRWSAHLATNGKQADCAPPSWLVDAINKATTPSQPAQEPVAWAVQGCSKMWRGEFAEIDAKAEAKRIGGTCVAYALHAAPPQRPWVGLTDEEKSDVAAQGHQRWKEYADAIEAKLKEKNT